CLFDVVNGQREEILTWLGLFGSHNSSQHDGIIHGYQYGARGLACNLASFENYRMLTILERFGHFIEHYGYPYKKIRRWQPVLYGAVPLGTLYPGEALKTQKLPVAQRLGSAAVSGSFFCPGIAQEQKNRARRKILRRPRLQHGEP